MRKCIKIREDACKEANSMISEYGHANIARAIAEYSKLKELTVKSLWLGTAMSDPFKSESQIKKSVSVTEEQHDKLSSVSSVLTPSTVLELIMLAMPLHDEQTISTIKRLLDSEYW